jgi:hypothetical protein
MRIALLPVDRERCPDRIGSVVGSCSDGGEDSPPAFGNNQG